MRPGPVVMHIFGIMVWFAGQMTALHAMKGYARAEVRGDFDLVQGHIGRIMDIGATMTVVSGIMLFYYGSGLALFKDGSIHAKFATVLALFGMHGFIRMRLGKYSRGDVQPVRPAILPITLLLFLGVLMIITYRPF